MRRIYLLSLFLLPLFMLSLNAEELDVSGDWELEIETPRGKMTRLAKFTQEGEKLTVIMKGIRREAAGRDSMRERQRPMMGGKGRGPQGEVKAKGSVKGDEIEWSVTRDTPRGKMTTTYKGKVSGDTMSGEVQFGNFGSFKWKAARKEEE